MKSKKIIFDNKVHVFLVIVQRQVLTNCRKRFPHLMLFPVVAESGCRHSSPIPLFHFKIRTCIWEAEGEKLLLVLTDTRLKMFLKYVFFHITVNFSETHPNCSYTYFLYLRSGVVSIRYNEISLQPSLTHFEEFDSVLTKVQPFVGLSFGYAMVKFWLFSNFSFGKRG